MSDSRIRPNRWRQYIARCCRAGGASRLTHGAPLIRASEPLHPHGKNRRACGTRVCVTAMAHERHRIGRARYCVTCIPGVADLRRQHRSPQRRQSATLPPPSGTTLEFLGPSARRGRGCVVEEGQGNGHAKTAAGFRPRKAVATTGQRPCPCHFAATGKCKHAAIQRLGVDLIWQPRVDVGGRPGGTRQSVAH